MTKQLIVVGGPNGAGKTTFVEQYLQHHPMQYLGADAIAAELSPDGLSWQLLRLVANFSNVSAMALEGDQSFIVESTLSGKSFANTIRDASSRGFWMRLQFIFLDGPDTSVARVQERVRRGGHHVPEVDVRRRFTRSLANFWRIYRPLVDQWFLTYNGLYQSEQVAQGDFGETVVFDESLLRTYFALAEIDPDDSQE